MESGCGATGVAVEALVLPRPGTPDTSAAGGRLCVMA